MLGLGQRHARDVRSVVLAVEEVVQGGVYLNASFKIRSTGLIEQSNLLRLLPNKRMLPYTGNEMPPMNAQESQLKPLLGVGPEEKNRHIRTCLFDKKWWLLT